jgi:putative DNA primase/helicase
MGDYATATDPATLSRQSFANGSRPTPDVAALQGTRLTTVGEPEKGMILDASRFKQWTGNSLITARRLHQDIFTFLPTFKIIFDSNHELEVSDMTIFKSGRMWVIPFDRFFSEEERDTGLKDRFRQQEYTNAIFLWCYWGYAAYKEKGFSDKPAAVIEATERFRKNSDRMEQFMDECMKPSERNTPGQTAYKTFREWVQAAGGQPIGKKGFFVELRRLGVLAATATVNGKTEKNVLVGYEIANELPFPA